MTVILELVTLLGSLELARYSSFLFVIFQPMFSGTQVRLISKSLMMNVMIYIKMLTVTRVTGASSAGENDVVSLVDCGWPRDLDVFSAGRD